MTRLVWSPRAERELEELAHFYGQYDVTLPVRLIDRVDHATAKLVDHPRLGSTLQDSDVRKWRALGTPFLLFYRPTAMEVRILKVRHIRSDWQRN